MWSILSLSQRSAYRKDVPWARLSVPGWQVCRGTYGGQSPLGLLVKTPWPSSVTLPSEFDIWAEPQLSSLVSPSRYLIICTHTAYFGIRLLRNGETEALVCLLPHTTPGRSSFTALDVQGWNLSTRYVTQRPIALSMLPNSRTETIGHSGVYLSSQGVWQNVPIVSALQHHPATTS